MDDLVTDYTSVHLKGLVTYYLCDQLFCSDIDEVFAIVNPADFPKNIKDSFFIKSNLDVDDLSIPIIDLHSLFDLKNGKITPTSRFICMEINKQVFAFLADKVEEMLSFTSDPIGGLNFIKNNESKYLLGKVKYGEIIFNLPNFKKIINESFVHY